MPVTAIVLPGESLAKYRHAAPPEHALERAPDEAPRAAESVAAIVETTTLEENDAAENEFDEPIHYPPENALPDAPLHKRAVEPDLAEVPAEPAVLITETAAEEIDAIEFLPETLESAEVSEHLAGESEDQPAVAPLLDDDEDSDIQAMILGDVEGIEIAPSDRRSGGGEMQPRSPAAHRFASAAAASRIAFPAAAGADAGRLARFAGSARRARPDRPHTP